MALFSKKKHYDIEDTDSLRVSEREEAINALEEQRQNINRELEEIMRGYAKLTKNKKLVKRRYRHNPPNEWRRLEFK